MFKTWKIFISELPTWVDTVATALAIIIFMLFIKPVSKYIVERWKGDRNRVAKMESDIGKLFHLMSEINANIVIANNDNKNQIQAFKVLIDERAKTNEEIKTYLYTTMNGVKNDMQHYIDSVEELTKRLNNVTALVAEIHGEHNVYHKKVGKK